MAFVPVLNILDIRVAMGAKIWICCIWNDAASTSPRQFHFHYHYSTMTLLSLMKFRQLGSSRVGLYHVGIFRMRKRCGTALYEIYQLDCFPDFHYVTAINFFLLSFSFPVVSLDFCWILSITLPFQCFSYQSKIFPPFRKYSILCFIYNALKLLVWIFCTCRICLVNFVIYLQWLLILFYAVFHCSATRSV